MSNKSTNWRDKDPEADREAQKYERPIPSRELILEHLTGDGGPLSFKQLAQHFGLDEEVDEIALSRRLEAMLRQGQLVKNRKGIYGPVREMSLVAGTVIGHRDGFGFLKNDDGGDDLFLPPRQMRSLMHGDRALVRISGEDHRGRLEGSLVDVLERAVVRVVGRFKHERGITFVIPDNARINKDILVPPESRSGAESGQIVTVEIVEQPSKHSPPIGKVVEVLGEHMAPGMEIDVAIRAHGLPFEWPSAVEAEAAELGSEVPRAIADKRRNLRDLPLVTIDGADARDFDDAVFCQPEDDGWRLWVAIADVSTYVPERSALDVEAQNRGNSVYFPEQVIPMLPEELSNGLCSLNPKVDRLCMVCEMRLSAQGKVTKSKFYQAVMRSHARLTYDQVAEALIKPAAAEGIEHLLPHLKDLRDAYRAFAKARRQRGAIDFETTETRIVFGTDRKIDKIVPVVRNDAHKMIEECMIAANVEAAKFLAKHKMPLLYRLHESPASDKLEELRGFLSEHGLSLGGGASPESKDFAKLLASVTERPDARLIQTVLLRSLKQAIYAPAEEDDAGHFGLALDAYAHFTSPIRRYPDLLVHRGIRHVVNGGKPKDFSYSMGDMQALGAHCSMTERRADEATRDAVDWLKCEYMRDRVGEEFEGLITGVTPFGLFVELDDVFVEGLIHVSSLRSDYYQHDPRSHCLRGERSGVEYHVADRLRVKVVRVDLDEKKIDFDLVGEPAVKPGGSGQKQGRNSGKKSGNPPARTGSKSKSGKGSKAGKNRSTGKKHTAKHGAKKPKRK